MKVAFLGSADFALPTLRALIDAGHEVAVGTQPARGAGRGRRARPTPVGSAVEALGVPVVELADVNDEAGLAWLAGVAPDVVVVVAFGQKLGSAVRAAAPWGCINVHPSLLPRWRGAAPVPAAILAGDAETGVCVIDVVERMDAGDVLAVRRTKVGSKSAGELLEELAVTGGELVVDTLDALVKGGARRRPQDESGVTRARKLTPDDGRVRWEHVADDVDRRVRAVTPRPGAFTLTEDGRRLGILRGRPEPRPRGDLPGVVVDVEDGLLVACGEGAYRILEVKPEGRRAMDVDAFLRGHPIPAGARFGP